MKLLRIPVMLLILLCLSGYRLPAPFAQNTPAEGEMFPDLKLPLPSKMQDREYLKIDRGPFLLSQIDTKVLIIEIFSIYCPICQKEAPVVNWLFRAISANPDIESRVKVLAIGAGNSLYEVDAFRNLFKVKFPLIPDGDFAVHRILGEVQTPYFFVLLKKPTGMKVVYSREGGIEDAEAFLQLVRARAGIGKGK
ncbi:MAG: TlpA disulfide reductase family protein [Syntrophobacteraceae bacterium]